MGRNSFAAISECSKSVNLQLRSDRRICYSELQAMRNRQTPYLRKAEPPAIRMTRRDRQILETIFAFDGMMSLKQIDRLFFSGTGGTWPRERLRALFDNGDGNHAGQRLDRGRHLGDDIGRVVGDLDEPAPPSPPVLMTTMRSVWIRRATVAVFS